MEPRLPHLVPERTDHRKPLALGSQAVDEGAKSVGDDGRNDVSDPNSQAADEGARSVGNNDGHNVLNVTSPFLYLKKGTLALDVI